MAEFEHTGGRSGDDLLPEHSILSLEEYLEMQRAIGNEIRFRVLNALVENGPRSARNPTPAASTPTTARRRRARGSSSTASGS